MRTGFWAALLVLAAGETQAQSLADVARQEEGRRKAISQPAKVYTNESLRGAPETPAPAPGGASAGAAAVAGTPPSPSGAPAPGPPVASSGPEGQAPPASAQNEAAWRQRVAEAREGLARSQAFAEALQSQINGLTTDFSARDDPAQRAQISTNRQKALAELERVKGEIALFQKRVADVQEEARRSGVPAGWVR